MKNNTFIQLLGKFRAPLKINIIIIIHFCSLIVGLTAVKITHVTTVDVTQKMKNKNALFFIFIFQLLFICNKNFPNCHF